ncbi:hypothetical protein ACHHYP_00781, partial [Achlya hypogyna]
ARLEQRGQGTSCSAEKSQYLRAQAEFQSLLSHFDVAEAVGTEALQLCLECFGPDHVDTLFVQGLVASYRGFQYKPREDWEPVLLEVIAKLNAVAGPEHENTLYCLMQLGNLYDDILGMSDEAQTLLSEALRRTQNVYGRDHERTIMCKMAFTLSEASVAEYDVAVAKVTACTADASRVLGPHHPASLAGTTFLSLVHTRRGGSLSNLVVTDQASVDTHKCLLGDDHQSTQLSIINLATTCLQQGDVSRTIALVRPIVDAASTLGDNYILNVAMAHRLLAAAYDASGEWAMSVAAWERAIDGFERANCPGWFRQAVWANYWSYEAGQLLVTVERVDAVMATFTRAGMVDETWPGAECLTCQLPFLEGTVYVCPTCGIRNGVVCGACVEVLPQCLDCGNVDLAPALPPPRALLSRRVRLLESCGPNDALSAATEALRAYCESKHVPMTTEVERFKIAVSPNAQGLSYYPPSDTDGNAGCKAAEDARGDRDDDSTDRPPVDRCDGYALTFL